MADVSEVEMPSTPPSSTIEAYNKSLLSIKEAFDRPYESKKSSVMTQWTTAIDTTTRAEIPSLKVLVTGESGHGKTALINALLEEEDLVPTSNSEACMAVVTKIAYNHEDGEKYRAIVHTLSEEEWQRELKDCVNDLNSANPRSLMETDSPQRIAFLKLEAVFPALRGASAEILRNLNLEELIDDQEVSKVLNTPIILSASTATKIRCAYQEYVRTKSRSKSGLLEYWPLVKEVVVYVRHPTLETGAIIIDAPGWNDSNVARGNVREKALQDANCIFVVADAVRAATNQSATSFLTDQSIAQHSRDGKLDNLVFVCTKTDSINTQEARRDYEDDPEFKYSLDFLEQQIGHEKASHQGLADQLKSNKKAITACEGNIKVLNHEKKPLTERRATLKIELEKAKMDASGTKRPADEHAVPDKSCKRTRLEHHQIAADAMDDEHTESEAVDLDSSDNTRTEAFMTTFEGSASLSVSINDIKRRSELQIAIKVLQTSIDTFNAKINEERAIISRLDEENDHLDWNQHRQIAKIDAIRDQIKVLCIKRRNQGFKPTMQRKFGDIIAKLFQSDEDDEDDGLFFPEESETYQLPVFCVSATGFQHLVRRLQDSGRSDIPFSDVGDTEIPDLQAYIIDKAVQQREAAEQAQLTDLQRLLTSIYMWSAADGKFGRRCGKEESERQTYTMASFTQALAKVVSDLVQTFPSDIVTGLKSRMFAVIPRAATKAQERIMNWFQPRRDGGYAVGTLKAMARREGAYSTRTVQIDCNETFIYPFTQRFDKRWIRTFNAHVPKRHKELQMEVENSYKDFARELPRIAESLRLASHDSDECQKHALRIKDATIRLIVEQGTAVEKLQRRINRTFTVHAQETLKPLYAVLRNISGSGSANRMRTQTEQELSPKRAEQKMEHVAEKILDDLNQSLSKVGATLTTQVTALCQEFDAATGGIVESSGGSYRDLPIDMQSKIDGLLANAIELSLIEVAKPRDSHDGQDGEGLFAVREAFDDIVQSTEQQTGQLTPENHGGSDKVQQDVTNEDAGDREVPVKQEI